MAHDIKVNSVIAVLFSLLAIALYIIIRFKRWQWGVGSVISLALDALFTIGTVLAAARSVCLSISRSTSRSSLRS